VYIKYEIPTTTMQNLSHIVDPFCEKEFWESEHTNTHPISNPVSFATGGIIMLLPVFTHNIKRNTADPPSTRRITLFSLCRASLGIVGAGTMIFHAIDDQQTELKTLNFRMCDWLPIVLMCGNIFVLYLTKLETHLSERTQTIAFLCMYIWTCVLTLAVDSTTYERMTLDMGDSKDGSQSMYGTAMNILLLVPLGLILAYTSYKKFSLIHSAIIWGLILINLILWVLNAYLCRDNLWMSMFHALYHVTIAYTFLYATCLGMTLDDHWEMVPKWWLWPMVQRKVASDETELKSTSAGNNTPTKDPCELRLEVGSKDK